MDKQLADDLADAFEQGRQQGFQEALSRVTRYADCIAGKDTGDTCKWFAKNCQVFIPVVQEGE
jgi:hypothetical protein